MASVVLQKLESNFIQFSFEFNSFNEERQANNKGVGNGK